MKQYHTIVIGGGPAGLAAAESVSSLGKNVLIIEREARLGGILKQCIHDGFGLIRFKERLTGPEYAERYINMIQDAAIDILTNTYVTSTKQDEMGITVTVVNETGVHTIQGTTLILSTGCRERTARQVNIHGTRPAGIYTAGTAQHFVNCMGAMPCKKCVILGSGDIGLIMARRLTLEGATVVGVYEAKSSPSGLTRNIHQCLHDFNIPLYLSHTVTKVYGTNRVEGVEISKVDDHMQPINGSEYYIDCDSVILSVGLIPENELAESLGINLDPRTHGPIVDQNFMTSCNGIFSCGNCLHVNDLVDYVSENAKLAGIHAATFEKVPPHIITITIERDFLYVVPQQLNLKKSLDKIVQYFRVANPMKNVTFSILLEDQTIYTRKYPYLKPAEMERITVDFSKNKLTENSKLIYRLEGEPDA